MRKTSIKAVLAVVSVLFVYKASTFAQEFPKTPPHGVSDADAQPHSLSVCLILQRYAQSVGLSRGHSISWWD
jgi:hypothetical protein